LTNVNTFGVIGYWHDNVICLSVHLSVMMCNCVLWKQRLHSTYSPDTTTNIRRSELNLRTKYNLLGYAAHYKCMYEDSAGLLL